MKSTLHRNLWMILLSVAAGATAVAQVSGNELSWATLSGGGGQSSGGNYILNGTIGQPATRILSGGGYTIQSGFWGADMVVPTPDAPVLRITRSASGVMISWTDPAGAFFLEQTDNLARPGWIDVPVRIAAGQAQRQVELPAAAGYRFFRLRSP